MDKKKKSLIIEAIREVGNGLSSVAFDINSDAKKKLDALNKGMAVLSKEKGEAEHRLRDMQDSLQSIAGLINKLERKQTDIRQKSDILEKTKEELEAKVLMLKEEGGLDKEIKGLRDTARKLQDETDPLTSKLKKLESDKESISELKNNLAGKIKSVAYSIRVMEKEIPEMRAKERDLELCIQAIGETEQRCSEVKTEHDNLENELQQAEKRRYEITDLINRKNELQNQLNVSMQEKERREEDIEEMSNRKDRVEELNAALEAATGERDRLDSELQAVEEKLQVAGKQGKELEVELGNIKQEKAGLQQKRADLELKSKPITDVISKVGGHEEAANKAKADAEMVVQDIHKRKAEISQIEIEKRYYEEALGEVKASIGI